MSRIDFYHLQKQTLEQVLPKLIEKAYETGAKIKIKIGNEARVEFINSLLHKLNITERKVHTMKLSQA